jgi:tRNA threonylcarbamoyladenosine biosynthesis protein TsaE
MHPLIVQRWCTLHADATKALGLQFGRQAHSGDFIACDGALGVGKTMFIQGFADGLGIYPDEYVRSPTFTLVNEYQGSIPLYHFDLYRISCIEEAWDIGFEEYLDTPGVIIVEWAHKFPLLLPPRRLSICITAVSCETRYVQCTIYDITYIRYFRRNTP